MSIRIGNGAGFLGDSIDTPRGLVESGSLDCLTLEYLAELTMSILARSRDKDPRLGYAIDFLEVLADIVESWSRQPDMTVVTNAGGVNPFACAAKAGEILVRAGRAELPIGVVTGDDLLGRIDELAAAGCTLDHFDTGEPLASVNRRVVCANAYLGAEPIAAALAAGAGLVITGRVADASLTVAPAQHAFGWAWDDWPRLAQAAVAGHIIECGAQATGGFYPHSDELDLVDVGYPIAVIDAQANVTITKPPDTGGRVSRETVSEQLVYEIGDPSQYHTPDVTVDFTSVEAIDIGPDEVSVIGTRGMPPPDSYKVSAANEDGFTATGQLLVWGSDCVAKARAAAELIRGRLQRAGWTPEQWHVECLGAGDGVPGVAGPPADLREVVLRVTMHDRRRGAVERFAKEIAPLATSGPAGLAGYAAGRPAVRPIYAYWPSTVPRRLVHPTLTVRTAAEWAREAEK